MNHPFDPFAVSSHGVQLIEASAGTGKTYSLTSLYLRLLLEKRLGVERILVVTFTEAATAELHERIRSRLRAAFCAFAKGKSDDEFLKQLLAASRDHGADLTDHGGSPETGKAADQAATGCRSLRQAGRRCVHQVREPGRSPQDVVPCGRLGGERLLLGRALSDIDQAPVSTIHGFARRILQEHALESGLPFALELTAATEPLLAEVCDDYWSGFFAALDHRLAALIMQGLPEARKSLCALVREAVNHGDFEVWEPAPAEEELAARQDEFRRLYREARDSWQERGEGIKAFFAAAPGLAKSFRGLVEQGLFARLDAFLAGAEPPSFVLPEGSELLAAERILDPAAKVFTITAIKNGECPADPFSLCWSRLVNQAGVLARGLTLFFLAGAAARARAELPRRLLAGGQQSFDQLLTGLDRALRGPQGERLARQIRARFPVALIDEFQDTDPVQCRIFAAIYGSAAGKGEEALFMIGDPKQAIYAFRGADLHSYLDAGRKAAAKFTMTTNWRADARLVAALNDLFSAVPRPFINERIVYQRVSANLKATDAWQSRDLGAEPLEFLIFPEGICPEKGGRFLKQQLEALVPDLVAGDIAALLAGGGMLGNRPVRPGDIAVLVRKNRQAGEVQASLRRLGINAVLQSKESVLSSAEAEDCLYLLAAVAEPGDESLRRRALSSAMLGFIAPDFARLNQDEAEGQDWVARFAAWQELWLQLGVMGMLLAVWREQDVAGRLLPLLDGERRLTNLRHLAELLQKEEGRGHLSPEMLVDWLARAMAVEEGREEAELRLESDEDAVQLVTVHRSKGLEYPVVYCPYLFFGAPGPGKKPFAGLHHDGRGRIVLLPDEGEKAQALEESFAEELRLAYVALTRARHCCRVFWAPVNGYEKSPLAWLLHGRALDAGEEESPAGFAARLASTGKDELLAQLRARADASQGWRVGPLSEPPVARAGLLSRAPVPAKPLTCRVLERRFVQSWRTGSFSRLVAEESREQPEHEPEAWPEAWEEHFSLAGGLAEVGREPEREAARLPLAVFPKGPLAGNFFHHLFEVLPFKGLDQARLKEEAGKQLRFYGYDEELWLNQVCRAFSEVLATPLSENGFALGDLDDSQRLNELPFTFPVGPEADGAEALSAAILARPFFAHLQGLPVAYPESLRRLRFIPLRGFLKGFVDLVCVVDGKWYLLDYKSNHLGASRADYAGGSLSEAMAGHHYFLQYHIYTVALHRYLTARLPGYDYGRDFGGVFYLFFRGMSPETGPRAGVYADRPPYARIASLDRLFRSLAEGNGDA